MATSRPPFISTFRLPDLVSHCPFVLRHHKNGDAISKASDHWIETGCHDLTPKKLRDLRGLKAGELTAYCYPDCDDTHIRVVSDFMNYLFHLDNISDGMMTKDTEVLADIAKGKKQPKEEIDAGKLARDYWSRCIEDAGPGVQARFCESFGLFFQAVNQQAMDRDAGVIPSLDAYISIRRDTSGCKPVFDLIEYAQRIELPYFVVNDPVIVALKQGTNDLVTWSNDIFSYNVEQSRADTHNMVVTVMKDLDLDLQAAIDYVGELCRETIETFCENRTKIPSWGPDVDKDVAVFVRGLEDWIIVGSLHWSFITKRYFGKNGAEIKTGRIVRLLSKPVQRPNAA